MENSRQGSNVSFNSITTLIILVAVMIGLFIPTLFDSEAQAVIAAETDKLQITEAQSSEYESTGVVDGSELVTIGEDTFFVNAEGKLVTGFILDGEFRGRATTEKETKIYINHLHKNGELEIPNAWSITWLEKDFLMRMAIVSTPLILVALSTIVSVLMYGVMQESQRAS